MSATKCDSNCVTNLMQPIYILCNFMFSDVISCQNTSKLHLFIDLTCHMPIMSHAYKLHIGLPVVCHGLYVMCEGLPVT